MGEARNLEDVSWGIKVTDRGVNEYQKFAHFDVNKIPEGARVLNLGSGLSQRFEMELKKLRPDISVISIDPSILREDFSINSALIGKEGAEQRRQRLSNKTGTVAAVGQKLPLPDESIDLAVDVHGPAQYAKSEEIYKDYLREVMRVLKPGARLHISHVYFGDPIPEEDKSLKEATENAKRIFKELGFKAEVFQQKVGTIAHFISGRMVDVDDIRIGAIVTKV